RSAEMISAKGVIFGGRIREEANSILVRKAQINALSAEHHALVEKQSQLRHRRDEIERQANAAADRLEHLREQHQAARATHVESSSQVSAVEREWQEVSRKFDATDWERATLEHQLVASGERVRQLQAEAAEQREFLATSRDRQSEMQSLVE